LTINYIDSYNYNLKSQDYNSILSFFTNDNIMFIKNVICNKLGDRVSSDIKKYYELTIISIIKIIQIYFDGKTY
jgi:hypothetical protein